MIRRLANGLLRWFCHPDYYPDISGDLEELYSRNLIRGRHYAGGKYFFQVLMLVRPSLMRDFGQDSIFKNTGMLKNYLIISFRSLARHKAYSLINISGLAVGLAAFLLINQYVRFERSYDTFFTDADEIYRLTTDQIVDGQMGVRDAMSFPESGKVLMDEFPEITAYTVTNKAEALTFRKGESLVREERVLWADDHFLEIFDYRVISQGTEQMLAEPNTVVLTQSKAAFYFGEKDPIGETIRLYSGMDKDFKVVGVIADVPGNTHYGFDILLSIVTIHDRLEGDGWNGYNYYTYLKINRGTNIDALQQKLVPLAQKYMVTGEETSLFFNLQPMLDIHLHSEQTFEPEEHGSARAVRFLEIISVFILVIAWVNYINLTTAKSVDRAKEIGLRKVIGAVKSQLRIQFLIEAFLINGLAAVFALMLALLATPFFNHLVGKEVIANVFLSADFLLRLAFFLIAGVLISGLYPALILSNFNITTVLKGKFRNSQSGIILRKSLVVAQFGASIVLIAGTLIVTLQVRFMKTQDKGLNTAQVVGFYFPNSDGDPMESMQKRIAFLNELEKHSEVLGTARISNLPGGGSSDVSSNSGGVKITEVREFMEATTYVQGIDHKALDLLGIEVLYGRNFKENADLNQSDVLVNEAFITRFGVPVSENIVGQKMQRSDTDTSRDRNIVGVVKNVNRSSLKNAVEPTVYFPWRDPGAAVVKLSAMNIGDGLKVIEEKWKTFYPTESLKYSFLDDRYASLYQADQQFESVFRVFSFFALFVALLGLFGLSSFMASQRTKEVGVRKVLGASVPGIIGIFYKEFFVLLCISGAAAVPSVYLAMNGWLENYANRIVFPWYAILIAVLVVLVCAFAMVGYQVWKVAVLNPAKTLKYE